MSAKDASVLAELAAIRGAGRWRAVRKPDEGGTPRINFSSNDYLGLARDPRVIAAAQEALAQFGAGAGASRLMAGHLDIHEALEAALAAFLDMPEALVFPSGYQANIGTLTALGGVETTIFSDALNHASLIDGARLSRSQVQVYPHNDAAALDAMLSSASAMRRALVVTESVFSMDGDCAPVAELAEVAARHGAWLVVDEAHAIGVYGEGRGLCAVHGVHPDVVLGTLSKALGSQGGFVACGAAARDLLVNKARTFIFTTGLAPASAAAGLRALEIVRDTPGLGASLLRKAALLREVFAGHGLDAPGESQIVPVLLGDEAVTMRAADACRARGVLAHGIRPPTVPAGACRLRLSVNLGQDDDELRWAAGCVAEAVKEARA